VTSEIMKPSSSYDTSPAFSMSLDNIEPSLREQSPPPILSLALGSMKTSTSDQPSSFLYRAPVSMELPLTVQPPRVSHPDVGTTMPSSSSRSRTFSAPIPKNERPNLSNVWPTFSYSDVRATQSWRLPHFSPSATKIMGPWFSDEPQPFLPDGVEIKRVPSSPNNSSPVLHEFEIMATSSTNKGLDSLEFETCCFKFFMGV
jgi:hypothetical protein